MHKLTSKESGQDKAFNLVDRLCLSIDQAVRTLFGNPKTTDRKYPGKKFNNDILPDQQRNRSASMMRVNHAGEVCAQALYLGQAIFSKDPNVAYKMEQAAIEEGDHLTWCAQRLDELGSHTSFLNPFWFVGSFVIGMSAAIAGDQWSLGFLAETEKQVVDHLQKHLDNLENVDPKTYAILQQMQMDEARHQHEAVEAGAKELPAFVKKAMTFTSQLMVKITYKI